ncbi:MAG: DUF72 domain-containing protein [Burkholderiaceae bacterium]|nr:DUF72 domain-containing protein [Burkholderiaceae bacterium]
MIRIGTASWTDPTLLASGCFYPPGVRSPAERLAYYANQFPLVEINGSYYALPDAQRVDRWARHTPDRFRFHAKAFRLFTGHPTPVAAFPIDIRQDLGACFAKASVFENQLPADIVQVLWSRFLEGLEPLRLAGRLDAIHCQFPHWVRPDTRGHALVERTARQLSDHTFSVKWRHRSWLTGAQRAATLAWQREIGAVHTVVDSPEGFDDTAPAVWTSTHPDLAIVRLHGRNAQAWHARTGASSGRFMYEYSDDKLADLAAHIKRLSAAIARTHVVLNTNYQDQGMRNAQRLSQALAQLA